MNARPGFERDCACTPPPLFRPRDAVIPAPEPTEEEGIAGIQGRRLWKICGKAANRRLWRDFSNPGLSHRFRPTCRLSPTCAGIATTSKERGRPRSNSPSSGKFDTPCGVLPSYAIGRTLRSAPTECNSSSSMNIEPASFGIEPRGEGVSHRIRLWRESGEGGCHVLGWNSPSIFRRGRLNPNGSCSMVPPP